MFNSIWLAFPKISSFFPWSARWRVWSLFWLLPVVLLVSVAIAVSANAHDVRLKKGSETYFVWSELPASLLLQSTGGVDPWLFDYRTELVNLYGANQVSATLDPYRLMKRQRKVYEKVLTASSDKSRMLEHYDKFIDRNVGQVSELSRLEVFLFKKHFELNNSFAPRSEFIALVLQRGEKLKVYAGFATQTDGIAPSLKDYYGAIRIDLKQGWVAKSLIHNHPFLYQPKEQLDNPKRDWGGSMVLSSPDVYAFYEAARRWGLETFSVSNGFQTLILNQAELKEFPSTLKVWPPQF